MQAIPITLPVQWVLQVRILVQECPPIKATLDNHSMDGRGVPILGQCTANLPKTQVSGLSRQRMRDLCIIYSLEKIGEDFTSVICWHKR